MREKTAAFFFFLLIISAGCGQKQDTVETTEARQTLPAEKHSNYSLPFETRDFYVGVVPNPQSLPEPTQQKLVEAYEEASRLGEVSMIWPQTAIGAADKLEKSRTVEGVRNLGMKPIINLNFYTIRQEKGAGLIVALDAPGEMNDSFPNEEFRKAWVSEAQKIASVFRPEYLSLGNEVGAWQLHHPETFGDYVEMYSEAYYSVKNVSPETMVFVVFSLKQLDELDQWSLIELFEPRMDLLGITTYPWQEYESPEEIPEDYYSRIKKHSGKPVAFTEIGWNSSSQDEETQARFIKRFFELTQELDKEFVNWLFLHETDIGGTVGQIANKETGSVALKRSDGSEKPAYWLWKDLAETPVEKN